MKVQGDVDIDFANRDDLLSLIPHVVASRYEKGELKKHNSGIYLQNIPKNPLTGICSIDYEAAAARGYFKIDFLNVSAYQGIRNEKHIEQLLSIDPIWELLYEKDICDQLVHVNGYNQLLSKLRPASIEELAIVLALIRPGKKHLLSKCLEAGYTSINDEIWTKPEDNSYYFKKSHATSYAHLIVMQLNKICETVSASS